MKIAYIGDFLNHGGFLYTSGTPIVILLSLFDKVDLIEVFSPDSNSITENFVPPPKVIINPFYRREAPFSILKLLTVDWSIYDIVIFNMLPTGFGNGTIANAFALIVLITLRMIFRQSNIRVIYHNSVFTNDIRKLGYNSAYDRLRSFFLRVVERTLFKNVDTFVLLNLYKKRIDDSIGKNKVHVLNGRYLEAITTLYLNKVMDAEYVETRKTDIPTILMHGSWGPQKNIELGLMALKKLKREGVKFRLVISGGLNHHFPEYKRKFEEVLRSYSDVIDEYLGHVTEKGIMRVFLDASLLILPYNTPGGHSGVLEQAMFFEVPTIALDFPEFREQANGASNVKLINTNNFFFVLVNYLKFLEEKRKINFKDKIIKASINVKQLVRPVTEV